MVYMLKVGDKVKVIKAPKDLKESLGWTGTVEQSIGQGHAQCVMVDFGFERIPDMFFPEELELVLPDYDPVDSFQ